MTIFMLGQATLLDGYTQLLLKMQHLTAPPLIVPVEDTVANTETSYCNYANLLSFRLLESWTISHSEAILAELITGNLIPNLMGLRKWGEPWLMHSHGIYNGSGVSPG